MIYDADPRRFYGDFYEKDKANPFLTLLSPPFILGVGLFTVCSVLSGLPYTD